MDLHAFKIQAIGQTNTKGQRIKITSMRYGTSHTIPVNTKDNYIWDTAKRYLGGFAYEFPKDCTFEMGTEGDSFGLVSTTFENLPTK